MKVALASGLRQQVAGLHAPPWASAPFAWASARVRLDRRHGLLEQGSVPCKRSSALAAAAGLIQKYSKNA